MVWKVAADYSGVFKGYNCKQFRAHSFGFTVPQKKKKKNPSILLQHSVSVLQWAGVTSAWLGIVQLPEFV